MVLSPGDQIGNRYRVVHKLGSGGMGEVWSAQTLATRRPVAIKVLLERASRRRDIVRRFEREAEATARISSPYVCRLLDTGLTSQRRLFLVFELLQGESLADRLRRELFLPLDEVSGLMCDVFRGIADAHAAEVLHRDLKPGNIFISPTSDGGERGIILDLGVSKLGSKQESTEDTSLTAYDGTVGSFAYMAPEQVRGAARVDARADVYGAAAVAFRALTGRLPFIGATANMVASLKVEQNPPSLLEATGLQWPLATEAFFACALARDPAARFESARAALEELVALRAHVHRVQDRAASALARLERAR